MAEVLEHCWDVRVFADNSHWSYRAFCTCGWKGQLQVQMMRGKSLENKTVPLGIAAEEGLRHVRASR